MRRLTLLLVPAVTLGLTGCGTLWNLCSIDDPNLHHQQAPREVYGGVAFDAKWAAIDLHDAVIPPDPSNWTVLDSAFGFVYAAAMVADMPLSATADTLTLPLTVKASTDRAVTDFYNMKGKEAAQERAAEPPSANRHDDKP